MKEYVIIAALTAAAAAQAGVLYVSSDFNHEVLRYDSDTFGYLDVFAASDAENTLDQPHAILARCDDVLVASFGNHRVQRFDRTTGAYLGDFAGPGEGLNQPVYILVGPDDNYYVSSQGNDRVVRFMPDGTLLGDFVTEGSGGLDGPSGLAFSPDGTLYVAGRYSANLLAYDGTTGAFVSEVMSASDGLGEGDTFGLMSGGDGQLYGASGGRVYAYDLQQGTAVFSAALGFPIGLEAGPGGIYVALSNSLSLLDTNTMTLGPALLSGGTINVLNFFHFEATAFCGEGEGEGLAEGEGEPEGESTTHTADRNGDYIISLVEILRVIQFYNAGGLHCAAQPLNTEDGYDPGFTGEHACTAHNTDYAPQDWVINLSELLRLIQIYNAGGYFSCSPSEDGFCPVG